MTGFARAAADHGGEALDWEVKSVNGKSAEVRLRLPQGFERLEPTVRQAVQKRFSRGNFQATLTVGRPAAAQAQPVVNEAFLKDLAGLAKRLQEQFGTAPPSADGLLALRGVLDMPEAVETEDERAAFDAAIMSCFGKALDGLEQARRVEGEALRGLLSGHLDTIETLTLRAEADPSREPASIRARIASAGAIFPNSAPVSTSTAAAAEPDSADDTTGQSITGSPFRSDGNRGVAASMWRSGPTSIRNSRPRLPRVASRNVDRRDGSEASTTSRNRAELPSAWICCSVLSRIR